MLKRVAILRCSLLCLCLVVLIGRLAHASSTADVVLFLAQQEQSTEEEAIHQVVNFYGLNIRSVNVSSPNALEPALMELRKPGTLAVLISAEALSMLNPQLVQSALYRSHSSPTPILVFGIKATDISKELKSWSGGAIRQCSPVERGYSPKALKVGNEPAITRSLAGLQLQAVAVPGCRLRFEPATAIQPVLSVTGDAAASDAAVLVRYRNATAETFFVPQMTFFDSSWIGKRNVLSKAFSAMAPYLIFLSHAARDYAWHSDGHYANLTIDDAWLTQPFGNLDYKAVLAEMEAHNFHTTIAFIPWNFDRSEPDLIELFLQHPDRFSVCIHGNNHTHQEFAEYSRIPLKKQVADIKQSIARMERFRELTGIPYDRFMVFPHGIAPEATFTALRRYGFSGTANVWNVPMDKEFPADPTFLLRPYTNVYEGLLSLSRYPAAGDVPQLEIAIHSFLGSPLLFYGHEDLFETGANSFDAHADAVNRFQPDTRWTSLGEIARHSHLLRRRTDGDFDVMMFSSEMDLMNPDGENRIFYIQWNEKSFDDIASLTVDAAPAAVAPSADGSQLRLEIPPHQFRRLRIAYQNDLDAAREDVGKHNLYARVLRTVSDFRDLRLSRSFLGRALTRNYYGHHRDELELYLEQRWWVMLICAGLFFAGIRYRRRRTVARVEDRALKHIKPA